MMARTSTHPVGYSLTNARRKPHPLDDSRAMADCPSSIGPPDSAQSLFRGFLANCALSEIDTLIHVYLFDTVEDAGGEDGLIGCVGDVVESRQASG